MGCAPATVAACRTLPACSPACPPVPRPEVRGRIGRRVRLVYRALRGAIVMGPIARVRYRGTSPCWGGVIGRSRLVEITASLMPVIRALTEASSSSFTVLLDIEALSAPERARTPRPKRETVSKCCRAWSRRCRVEDLSAPRYDVATRGAARRSPIDPSGPIGHLARRQLCPHASMRAMLALRFSS